MNLTALCTLMFHGTCRHGTHGFIWAMKGCKGLVVYLRCISLRVMNRRPATLRDPLGAAVTQRDLALITTAELQNMQTQQNRKKHHIKLWGPIFLGFIVFLVGFDSPRSCVASWLHWFLWLCWLLGLVGLALLAWLASWLGWLGRLCWLY